MNGLTFSSVVVCYKNTNQIYLLSVEKYKVDIVFKERPFKFNLKRQKRNNARAYYHRLHVFKQIKFYHM